MPHAQPGNNAENSKLHFRAEVMTPTWRNRRKMNNWD